MRDNDLERRKIRFVIRVVVCGSGVLVLGLMWVTGTPFRDLFSTPDRRGAWAFHRGDFDRAVDEFADPVWRGVARYRSGDFEGAAADFRSVEGSVSTFNLGNSLVMLGKYEEAIQAYDRALMQRPGWSEAAINREIAILRQKRLAGPKDDAGGTGGKLEADSTVYDNKVPNTAERSDPDPGDEQPLSDEETRGLWLRSVQTSPGEFLKSKFAYQVQERRAAGDGK